jgi:GNAT superfamily N-acetyltransferase
MQATIVTTEKELEQIVQLSHLNQKANITQAEKAAEGFVSWEYSLELLKQMDRLHPSVIVKDNDRLVAYALVALKEAKAFHKDLAALMENFETIIYENKPLADYNYYVMGQVCIDKAYRGKGVFDMLFQHHKEILRSSFDFVVTEISTNNQRSVRAHEKVGFKTIYTYKDTIDEWNVVLWDWE